VRRGLKLDIPATAPSYLEQLMTSCWQPQAERPNARAISKTLLPFSGGVDTVPKSFDQSVAYVPDKEVDIQQTEAYGASEL